ncbi:MAG: hypothetical protein C0472_05770 [Erythrobacter sp.]|nr:hypothetical protein [Erythrobacter sp.]
MADQNSLKDIGGGILAIAFIFGLAAVGIGILYGAAEMSIWAIQWAPQVVGWVVSACLFILLPLSFFPATRNFAGNGFEIASFVFVMFLWVFAMAFTYSEWGLGLLVLGLMFFGVGVIFMSILAALFGAEWGALGLIAMIGGAALISRIFGAWLLEKAALRSIRLAADRAQRERIEPARRLDSDLR